MDTKAIALVLADVDGTLVTHEKVLTERAKRAVASLRSHGIGFAVTSGRPPRGMAMLFADLALSTPVAGFNGGLIVSTDLRVIESRVIPDEVTKPAVERLLASHLDVWLYIGNDWLVRDSAAPHVDREAKTVGFMPKVVDSLDDHLSGVTKIVGVSDDEALMQRCESEAQKAFGAHATVACSQPYYLDITHRDANKGAVVEFLSKHLGIAAENIATIGDQPNDISMFRKSGLSIAMGNAADHVKAEARVSTASCDDEGFAKAMEKFVLASHE